MTARNMMVTGSSGLLGSTLVREAAKNYRVVGVSRQSEARISGVHAHRCDLADRHQALACFEEHQPQVIIHAAALTDVERCEAQPDLAEQMNVTATAHAAEWARRKGALLVYISTDSVFDGSRGLYQESDNPNPLNQYAKTKWKAEQAVRQQAPDALIVRTNFFGWRLRAQLSLAEKVVQALVSRQPLTMFTDVFFSPLLVNDLSVIILELIAKGARGVYHAGSRDFCSKHDFALMLADEFGLPTADVSPISVDQFPFTARRPKNTSMRVELISQFLGRPMPSIKEGVKAFKEQLETGYLAGLSAEIPSWVGVLQNA